MSVRHMVATLTIIPRMSRIGLSAGAGTTVTASTCHTYQISKTAVCAQNALIEIKRVGIAF